MGVFRADLNVSMKYIYCIFMTCKEVDQLLWSSGKQKCCQQKPGCYLSHHFLHTAAKDTF